MAVFIHFLCKICHFRDYLTGPLVQLVYDSIGSNEEAEQVAASYVCVQIYSNQEALAQIPEAAHHCLLPRIIHTLISAQSQQLILNILGKNNCFSIQYPNLFNCC